MSAVTPDAERDHLRVIVRDVWAALFNANPKDIELLSAEHAAMLPAAVRATLLVAVQHARDLETERDRLRVVVERAHDCVGVDDHVLRSLATDDLVALVGVLRQDCRDAMIENDRLRAVVDAVVEFERRVPFFGAVVPGDPDNGEVEEARARVGAALDALDGARW